MKTKMKRKTLKIIAAAAAFTIIAALVWMACSLLGNPVSYLLAKNNAKKYVAEKYPGYTLGSVKYNFKFGSYTAAVEKPNSEDYKFAAYFGLDGKPRGDDYETRIENCWNTQSRLDMSYRKLVESVFDSPAFPYESDIDFGELIFEGDKEKSDPRGFAISKDTLEPDGLYDLAKLGEQGGLLTLYVDNEAETPERAAEILLDVDRLMAKGGVTFYAIDLRFGDYFVDNIRRRDIHADGLVERVKAARENTEKRYNELDGEKANDL